MRSWSNVVDLGLGATVTDLHHGFFDLAHDIVPKRARAATQGHPALTVRDMDTERTWAIDADRPAFQVSGLTAM